MVEQMFNRFLPSPPPPKKAEEGKQQALAEHYVIQEITFGGCAKTSLAWQIWEAKHKFWEGGGGLNQIVLFLPLTFLK